MTCGLSYVTLKWLRGLEKGSSKAREKKGGHLLLKFNKIVLSGQGWPFYKVRIPKT